jgi:hypothetical protein
MVIILHNGSGIWKPRAVASVDVIYPNIHLKKPRNIQLRIAHTLADI